MGGDPIDSLGCNGRGSVSDDVPDVVADDEMLNRRIHPDFFRPDGRISSQAFRASELSVDRAKYGSPRRRCSTVQALGSLRF